MTYSPAVASPARYRPIRTVAWGVYLFCALGFIGLVVIAVVRGVMSERAVPMAAPGEGSDPRTCARELADVYREVHRRLDLQRTEVGQDDAAANAAWAPLRGKLNGIGVRCSLREGGKDALARAYQKVLALQRLAESAAVQYRHEVGPTDLEARRLLGEAGAPITE